MPRTPECTAAPSRLSCPTCLKNYNEEDFMAVPAEETMPWMSKTGATVYKVRGQR